MLSSNRIKFIRSLQQKKFREQSRLFIVEGEKLVEELLSSRYNIEAIYTADPKMPFEAEKISSKEMKRISGMASPSPVLAIAHIPNTKLPDPGVFESELAVALEDISDPGNLGTTIRTADWFGVKHIICSNESVELYNPKVVQASMGSIFRVSVHHADLVDYCAKALEKGARIIATMMDGMPLQEAGLSNKGILLLGSESRGLTESLTSMATDQVTIPKRGNAESLNVAIAAGIFLSELTKAG